MTNNSRLDCSDHEVVGPKILRLARKDSSRIQTVNFRKAKCILFRELVGRIIWEAPLKGEVALES